MTTPKPKRTIIATIRVNRKAGRDAGRRYVTIEDGRTVVRGTASHRSQPYWAVIGALRSAYSVTTSEAKSLYSRVAFRHEVHRPDGKEQR